MDNEFLFSDNKPVSFLYWLQNQDTVSTDFSINFKSYQQYVQEWTKRYNNKNLAIDETFKALYIDLLKDITLNFATEEEKRFILNFDFSKDENLDIIIPFFIQKLKNICLYYSNKRENLKEKISFIPYKGTNFYIEHVVKSIIIDGLDNDYSKKIIEGKTTLPSLSAILKNLKISVEEKYDDINYFNSGIKENEFIESIQNVDLIDKNLYIDFIQAIKDAIKAYPVFIDKLYNNISINLSLSGTELNLLKDRDFINYINTLSSEDLKINLRKKLAPKYASSSFYYLSTGSTSSEFVTGVLFDAIQEKSQVTQNLSNINHIKIAQINSLDNLYAVYEIGKFFIPSKTGALKYNAFEKSLKINTKNLIANKIYVYPDPNIYESNIEDNENIVVYEVNLSWNKYGFQNGFRFGDVLSDSSDQLFYPYQSLSQDLTLEPYGIVTSENDLQFWSGNTDEVWDSEIWEGLDTAEKLPIENRLETLLIDKGQLVSWYIDIFGNEFGLFKNIKDNTTIFEKKKLIPGDIYIKNTITGLVSGFNYFFKDISFKYPTKVINEIFEGIYTFYLIKDIFVIETESYVIVDSYNYNFETGQFFNTLLPGIYIPKYKLNKYLEKFINCFYVESSQDLYLCFTSLLPTISSSNYKSIFPSIYKININRAVLEQQYPVNTFDATIYSLSSSQFKTFPEIDLKYLRGGRFSYNEQFEAFNLTYMAVNLNNIPFIINEQFSIDNGSNKLYSYIPLLHKPYYYVSDTNFSNPSIDYNLRFAGSYSDNIALKNFNELNWYLNKKDKDNFYFCSDINPVYINKPGRHYVQFDWDKYVFGNVFIGCENIGVAKVEEFNSVVSRTGEAVSINLLEEDVWYKIKDYTFNQNIYTLSAYRPSNTNNSIIYFEINGTGQEPNDFIFCNDLISTYRRVKVVKKGTGEGIVTGSPACIDCGQVCEFLYPLFGTITIIPSSYEDSVFAGWTGSPCQGVASNCIFNVTDFIEVTATFNRVPEYSLTISSNITGVNITARNVTMSGNAIDFPSNNTAIFKNGTVVLLSAGEDPEGTVFVDYKDTLASGNKVFPIVITNNTSVTAVYLSGSNAINVYNTSDTYIAGPIFGNDGEEDFQLLINNDYSLAYNAGSSSSNGTIFINLSADIPITTYANFVVPVNTIVSLSANFEEPTIFRGFRGTPCEITRSNPCVFRNTINRNISGIFSPPFYTLVVQNVGIALGSEGLFFTVSQDGGIDIGTLNLRNTRNRSFNTYLSGTSITLSAVGVSNTGIRAICSFPDNSYVLKEANDVVNGDGSLDVTFNIDRDTLIYVIGLPNVFSTLTIVKTGTSTNAQDNEVKITVGDRVDISPIGETRSDFTYPRGVNGDIFVKTYALNNRLTHVYGYSGLNYYFNTDDIVQVAGEQPLFSDELVTVFDSEYYPTNGNTTPIFTTQNSNFINVNYADSVSATFGVGILTAYLFFEELT